MTDMICSACGLYGIYWRDLTTSPWTYCPHCGCQRLPVPTCQECDGTGLENVQGHPDQTIECEACDGTGER